MKRRGFTLMELLAAIIIITILVSLAAPKFFSLLENSRQAQAIEVLTKMYKGYKTIVIDGLLDPSTYKYNPPKFRTLTNDTNTTWDPGISSSTNWDWTVLGFDLNPNANAYLFFAFDFWPKGIPPGQTECTPNPPSSNDADVAIARRRNTKGPYSIDFNCKNYIFIYCNNGTIYSSGGLVGG